METSGHDVLNTQTSPNNPTFFQKHDVFFLMLFASIVGIVLLVGIIFLSLQITLPEEEQTQVKTVEKDLPTLAYIEASGIASPENTNPDLGKLFLVNPHDGSKKSLTLFSKEELASVYDDPLYSPLTKEIIVPTKHAIIAVSTSTGAQRVLHTLPAHHESSTILSFDKISLYIQDEVVQNNVTVSTNYYQVFLRDKKPVSFPVSKSVVTERTPFRSSLTSNKVEVAIRSSSTIEVGRIIDSSTFTITDLSTGRKKEIVYNKPGDVVPLFQTKKYFYFKTNLCCVSTPFLDSMEQLDLTSGEFSSPSSVPEIYAHINNKAEHIEDRGISPDGKYYAYVVDNVGYIYDVEKKKEIPLKAIMSGNSEPFWSSDSKYFLHTGFTDEDTYIFNTTTKKLSHLAIPKDQYYLIIQ